MMQSRRTPFRTFGFPVAVAAGLFGAGAVATAQAQWTVTSLHPANAAYSQATGVSGGVQVGYVRLNGDPHEHACLWTGTAASFVDLDTPTTYIGYALGASGGQQVGQLTTGGYQHASLWTGTAASWVDLAVPGATESPYSVAWGVGDGQQVGTAYAGAPLRYRASLWTGTGASWINLQPAGPTYNHSDAFGAGGGQQVGDVEVNGVEHASLWSGTEASWVDLEPHPGLFEASRALAVMGGHQYGWVTIGSDHHASKWSGSAATWTDLHPAGANHSEIVAVSGTMQAGFVIIGGITHASVWSGTAASWVDLQTTGYVNSRATGIFTDSSGTSVSGYGTNNVTFVTEALLWKLPGCPADIGGPGGLPGDDGVLDNNDFIVFINWFFAADPRADRGMAGGLPGSDGLFDNNDFIVFINQFFTGC